MVTKIHIHAHKTVVYQITVETTHVVQVNPVQVAHKIAAHAPQPIHAQIQMIFSLELHVSMLKWPSYALALQLLHRHLQYQ